MTKNNHISLVDTKITIDGLPVELFVSKNKQALIKASRGNKKARSLVLRYFSDFIAAESPFTAPSASSFSDDVNTKDIFDTLSKVKKTYFSPISLSNSDSVSFNKANNIAATQNKNGFTFDKNTRVDKLSNVELINYINSNNEIKKIVTKQISQKFSNLFNKNYLDKSNIGDKALGSLVTRLLNSSNIVTEEYLSITAKPTKSGITLYYSLSDAGYAKVIASITSTTIKFHKALSTNISSRFINDALVRFTKGRSTQHTYDFLSAVIGIANEFEKRPINYSTKIIKPKQGKISTKVTKKNNRQTFISGAQLTALVQKRLDKTMKKSGKATPPWFTERSGRFRSSITVYPNYRNSLIRFTYMPLYDANIKYGYDPETQVSNSIREVVTSLYTRKFNIVRV